MTLLQLRTLCEVVGNGFSVSRAAAAMHVSQPAVSKMVRSLEAELGTDVFVRSKGRIVGLTELGQDVRVMAARILHDASSLTDMAAERFSEASGVLRIATTHVHARYAILQALRGFAAAFPNVDVELTQHDPKVIVDRVASGECHLGLGTLPGRIPSGVVTLPAYPIERCVIAPSGHPLLRLRRLRLEDVARYPLIAYDRVFVEGRIVHTQFEKRGLRPRILLKATDADVIKCAVASGLGIAILQRMAIEPGRDRGIEVIDARHLFPDATAYLTLRRGQYLRGFTYDLIARIAPRWSRREVDREVKR